MPQRQVIESYLVPESARKSRLYDYANGLFRSIPSRKNLQKSIKGGRILVNGEPGYTGTWIEPGMRLDLVSKTEVIPVCNIPFELVFEDPYICIINKPSGLPVSGNRRDTLRNAVGTAYLQQGLAAPIAIHRIDLPTSGLVVFAKTADVAVDLGRMFENREIRKTYVCIAHGSVPEAGRILLPIDGRSAETRWHILGHYRILRHDYTLVEVQPVTGRKHQIRRHFSAMGHPLAGDRQYGSALKGKGLFLHAGELHFIHPRTAKKIRLTADTPGKFRRMLAFLNGRNKH